MVESFWFCLCIFFTGDDKSLDIFFISLRSIVGIFFDSLLRGSCTKTHIGFSLSESIYNIFIYEFIKVFPFDRLQKGLCFFLLKRIFETFKNMCKIFLCFLEDILEIIRRFGTVFFSFSTGDFTHESQTHQFRKRFVHTWTTEFTTFCDIDNREMSLFQKCDIDMSKFLRKSYFFKYFDFFHSM